MLIVIGVMVVSFFLLIALVGTFSKSPQEEVSFILMAIFVVLCGIATILAIK
jgi:hypothetical protein